MKESKSHNRMFSLRIRKLKQEISYSCLELKKKRILFLSSSLFFKKLILSSHRFCIIPLPLFPIHILLSFIFLRKFFFFYIAFFLPCLLLSAISSPFLLLLDLPSAVSWHQSLQGRDKFVSSFVYVFRNTHHHHWAAEMICFSIFVYIFHNIYYRFWAASHRSVSSLSL